MIFALAIISLFSVLVSFLIKRSFIFLWFTGLFIFFYHVDALFTMQYGALFLSKTYSNIGYVVGTVEYVLLYSTIIVVVVAFANALFGLKTCFPNRADIAISFNFYVGVLFILAFVLYVVLLKIGSVDVYRIFYDRQTFFAENFLASIVLYIAPVLTVVAFVAWCHESRGVFRVFCAVVFLVGLGVSFFSGSRSALMLNALLPCGFYYFFMRSALLGRAVLSVKNIFAFSVVISLAVAGSSLYRDAARGSQGDVNMFVSPDMVSFDASVVAFQADVKSAPTYFSALTFFIPRESWPEKPVSGNYYFTQKVFPERFSHGGAEITASIVGESYINFGSFGVLSAAFFLFSIIVASEWLMRRGGWCFPLALIFVFRGVNLLRGDLLNILVPLFFACFVVYFISRRHSLKSNVGW